MKKNTLRIETMKFQIASNWIFDERDLANHVLTASDRICPKAWIFDCEADARRAADRLNKAEAKRGRINAVACIID